MPFLSLSISFICVTGRGAFYTEASRGVAAAQIFGTAKKHCVLDILVFHYNSTVDLIYQCFFWRYFIKKITVATSCLAERGEGRGCCNNYSSCFSATRQTRVLQRQVSTYVEPEFISSSSEARCTRYPVPFPFHGSESGTSHALTSNFICDSAEMFPINWITVYCNAAWPTSHKNAIQGLICDLI